ncbi:PEP-utilizing enzyme [Nocardia grenadensis]|uniref:PEP-utilizing enzyme n=1 Tax=Nocardia grenadensis TaxID=931537 RepID=UPI003D70927D
MPGLSAATEVLTSRGGPARHAAVVARAMGKPAVVRVTDLSVDATSIRTPGNAFPEGTLIVIDGTTGAVTAGNPISRPPPPNPTCVGYSNGPTGSPATTRPARTPTASLPRAPCSSAGEPAATRLRRTPRSMKSITCRFHRARIRVRGPVNQPVHRTPPGRLRSAGDRPAGDPAPSELAHLLTNLVELQLPLHGAILGAAGLIFGLLRELGGLVRLVLGRLAALGGLVGLALGLLGLGLGPVGLAQRLLRLVLRLDRLLAGLLRLVVGLVGLVLRDLRLVLDLAGLLLHLPGYVLCLLRVLPRVLAFLPDLIQAHAQHVQALDFLLTAAVAGTGGSAGFLRHLSILPKGGV